MDEFTEQPGPLAMFRKIPSPIRWWIYSVGATVFGVEAVLDLFEVGLIPTRIEEVSLGIFGLFGFTMAAKNTGK